MSTRKDARVTLAALDRAVYNRRPRSGVIFHTDRSIEYAAYAFRRRLGALGFVQSMNRPATTAEGSGLTSACSWRPPSGRG